MEWQNHLTPIESNGHIFNHYKLSNLQSNKEGNNIKSILSLNSKIWAFCTLLEAFIVLIIPRHPLMTLYDRGSAPTYNKLTASIILIGIVAAYIIVSSSKYTSKRIIGKSMAFCCVSAFVTYVKMSFDVGYSLPSGSGSPLYVCRYVEWLVSCPILLSIVEKLTEPESNALIKRAIIYAIIMLTNGFLASIDLNFSYVSILATLLSFASFVKLLESLFIVYKKALEQKKNSLICSELLKFTRDSIFLSWSICTVT